MSAKKVEEIPLRDNQIYHLDVSKSVWRNRFGKEIASDEEPSALAYDRDFWTNNIATLSFARQSVAARLVESDEYEHNVDASFVAVSSCAKWLKLETGNLVGKLVLPKSKCSKTQKRVVEVGSRFGDDFLRFIISDAHGFMSIREFGSQTKDESGWEWLLGYLWATKLKSALGRLGVPKAYVSRTERTPRPRGSIDPVDWVQPKTPGRWLATMREHSFDTPAAKLFLAAHNTLARRENIRSMGFLADVRHISHELRMATAGTTLSQRELLAVRPFRNPFYHDYTEVIELSKQVIRGFGASVGDDSGADAFLFDVSMLFEYFVRNRLRRLQDSGVDLRVKESSLFNIPHGGTYNDGRRRLIPDIVFDDALGQCHVYDVKYKYWDEMYGVNREDLFQMYTYVSRYLHESDVADCGFVYPISENRIEAIRATDRWKGVAIKRLSLQIAGKDIPFNIVFLVVPTENADRQKWAERFSQNCEEMDTFWINPLAGKQDRMK